MDLTSALEILYWFFSGAAAIASLTLAIGFLGLLVATNKRMEEVSVKVACGALDASLLFWVVATILGIAKSL